jgi:FAD:protein FMN transferase
MVERARPLLGTVVSIRIDDGSRGGPHGAIDAAFERVALVHRLMSFQDPDSELSRLNRDAVRGPLSVHAHTYRVLRWALAIAAASDGRFDVSATHRRDQASSWSDLQLQPPCQVRYRRPLRIDLSGIAKGYAVDLAIMQLRALGVRRAVVNAGGDLRVLGAQRERVGLRVQGASAQLALLELSDAAVATSEGPTGLTVSVLARRCVVADALTKVVLAEGGGAGLVSLLQRFGARAWIHESSSGWRVVEPRTCGPLRAA